MQECACSPWIEGYPSRVSWAVRETYGVKVIILRSGKLRTRLARAIRISKKVTAMAADDEREFEFTIYHNGVHFQAPVRGIDRFLRERAFLDDLVAPRLGRHKVVRPVPDPTTDFYWLTDEELDAYSAFRRQ